MTTQLDALQAEKQQMENSHKEDLERVVNEMNNL